MLELQNLVWELPDGGSIINGISCKLGSRLTVITGPNGRGKTSLAKLIAGVEKPTSGRILLDGEDITDLDITGRARLGVAYAFQQPVRFKGLTVRDLQTYFGFEEPQAIYKWQRGQSLPSVDNLYALGALLEVPLDEILVQARPQLNMLMCEQQAGTACCSPLFCRRPREMRWKPKIA